MSTNRVRPIGLLRLLVIPVALGILATALSARQGPETEPFEQAELFFELNDTDGDLGIHAAIDGGTWTSLDVEGHGNLLRIVTKGTLRTQGLTQLAFESAEPDFEELDPKDFFSRFPEGVYDIEGTAQEGGTFKSKVSLSHVMAAPPEATVSGLPIAENCDAVDLPEVVGPVLIDWAPVETSHPDIGKSGSVTISRYQFFVEQGETKLSVDLPPAVTEFEIPTSITDLGGVFKFEIIARTSTGNNTAIESCFRAQ
jgi:hypothetical protein